jgi:hypothetical protein
MEPVISDRSARWRIYFVALLITGVIFATAFYASNYFNQRRVEDIRTAQDNISTDILNIETQFDLLQEHSCSDVAQNVVLPSSLSSLGSQLSYMEAQGSNSAEITRLKGLYSLMEIKDYLLMKQISQNCQQKPVLILYFYSNKGDCADCQKQGYVLTALSQKFPQLRIYSFDYNLQVGALQTLIGIDNIENNPPALLINGKAYYGFKSIDDIEKILPQLATMKTASSTATSTK